jgi:hypothetical protein
MSKGFFFNFTNTLKNNTKYYILLPFFLLFILLTILVSGNSFFWDSILLSSRYAHWFIDTNFSSFILPTGLDAVHPPTFGLYLALCWSLFGKTLLVSHLAMLPFLAGIVWQLYLISKLYFSQKTLFFVLLFVLADPTLLAQSVLVSPDIALLFFFLLCMQWILNNKRKWLALSLVLLAFISVRGMFAVVSIYAIDLYLSKLFVNKKLWFGRLIKLTLPYIPAAISVCIYLLVRYQYLGYIIPLESANWGDDYQGSDFKTVLYNAAILCWRLLDFGRIGYWLVLIFLLVRYRCTLFKPGSNATSFFLFFALFILTSLPYLLLFKQPVLHRYLMPAYIFISLAFLYILLETALTSTKHKWLIYSVVLAGLISGNFWIYPDTISKGWDSTLAHLPYYKLRSNMLSYIKQQNIPIDSIGSEFPNTRTFMYTDLNEDNRCFPQKNLKTQPYILQSNIFNDFSDSELYERRHSWILVREEKKCGVYVRLYKNPS